MPASTASRIAQAAGTAACAVGLVVLGGWVFGIEALRTIYGPITMKANAALGLVLCGAAIVAIERRARIVATACALLLAAIGTATLFEHTTGIDLGIDQLIAEEAPGAAATTSPNRMGPNASTSFTLASAAFLLLVRGTPASIAIAQRISLVPAAFALLAIAGYLYGAVELYGIARYTGIALHTAIMLLVVQVGILAVRADDGPMAIFISPGPAGTLLRRIAAPVLLLPLAFGYLVILGRQADVFDRGLSIATLVVLVIVVLGTIIWSTARVIERSDNQRRQAEHNRDLLLERERRARDDAERANRLKDHFLATLSHELRTPLNVMLGWTQILEAGGAGDGSGRAAAVVARNGRLLARLVEDLLDISRASSGQFDLTPQPIDVNVMARTLLDGLAPEAAAREIALTADLDPTIGLVQADPARLQQIATNLLNNALKFTGRGGRVTLRTEHRPDGLSLTVDDTGVGFDPSFAAHLFEPFRQEDPSSSREHGGLGLGLSIARHLAELHGGQITGTSPGPGCGATFVLFLPYQPLIQGPGAPGADPTGPVAALSAR